MRAVDLGKGFSDGHFSGSGEDTGLHLNSRQRAGNCDDFNLACGSRPIVLMKRLIMLIGHFQESKKRHSDLVGNILFSYFLV